MNNATFAARVWAVLREGSMTSRQEPGGVCACGAPAWARGLCRGCYQRAYRADRLPPVRREPEALWSVADVAGAFGVRIIVVLHWIWNGALAARPDRTGRYSIGDGALHAFLWRYPAAWQAAPIRDRAWVAGLLTDPDLCKCATEPADVRAARRAAERAGVAA